ncbi:uncharacterized protein LOC135682499 [Rhopilema esculentum]|uniref:uncharacterized protein LOC135682499 n=1 Tax=Rhopilema esculentum TaxID=499914 RepID=UPI0031D91E1E
MSSDDLDIEISEEPSTVPKPDLTFDPNLLMTLMSQMEQRLSENSKILSFLVEKDTNFSVSNEAFDPACKKAKLGLNPSFAASPKAHPAASLNAISAATEIATATAAETATTFLAAETATNGMGSPIIDLSNARPSEEDALSLFGRAEFDPSDPSEMENEALLTSIDKALLPSTEKGPPISAQLAKIIDGKFGTEFDLSKRKEILDKYHSPENCQTLFSPKINPEIWGKLNPNSKRNDIKLSVLQDGLIKATSAVSVAVSDLLFACFNWSRKLTFKRRDSPRPHLSAKFKQVCSRNVKLGNFIFGMICLKH